MTGNVHAHRQRHGAGAGSTPLAFTGDAGASTININTGGVLRANGDTRRRQRCRDARGHARDRSSALNLGDGNDTLTLNDTGVFTGTGFNAGQRHRHAAREQRGGAHLDGGHRSRLRGAEQELGGTLTLTGDHSYSAGTTIGAGVLQIGDGGTSGSITATCSTTARSTFNRSERLDLRGHDLGQRRREPDRHRHDDPHRHEQLCRPHQRAGRHAC